MNYANPVVNIPNYLQSSFICIPWTHNIYMLPKAGKLSVDICGVVLLEFVKDMFSLANNTEVVITVECRLYRSLILSW